MNKVSAFLLCLLVGAGGGGPLFGQTCATQSDGTVALNITITPGVGVNEVRCDFAFSLGLAGAAYSVTSSPADPSNFSNVTANRVGWTDSGDYDVGYHVVLDVTGTELTIERNPADSGTFGTGDILSWTLTITGIPGPYESTITIDPRDSGLFTVPGGAAVLPTPCNIRPTVAGIKADPSLTAPLVMEFSADTPHDDDGTVADYIWTFGDATTDTLNTNDTFPHLYGSDNSYTVRLRVKDNDGALSDEVSRVIQTNQRPRSHAIEYSNSTSVPREVNLRAITPTPNPDPDTGDTIATYRWDFGDSTPQLEATTNNLFTHRYGVDGSYTVSLVVVDDKGLPSDPAASTTANPDREPTVSFTATAVAPSTGQTINNAVYGAAPLLLSLDPSFDDDTPISQYRWDLAGDEKTVNAPIPVPDTQTKGFNSVGLYSVGLIGRGGSFDSDPARRDIFVLPGEKMHFPRAIGVPYDAQRSPVVDGTLSGPDGVPEPAGEPDAGQIYGENGWRGAFKIAYGNGTDAEISFQGIRDNTQNILYIGIEVDSDDALGATDQIVLGIRGSSDSPLASDTSADRLLRITPSADQIAVHARSGPAWSDQWAPAAIAAPAGMIVRHKPPTTEHPNRWSAEIQVPMAADSAANWPAIGEQFLFLVEVYRSSASPFTSMRATWPRSLEPIAEAGWETTHANPIWWGSVDLSSSSQCNGLSLPDYASLGARDPANPTGALTSSIRYKQTGANDIVNTIVARVRNDTYRQEIDAADAIRTKMLPVEDVSVSFRIANWGIPPAEASYWEEIRGSPTTPPRTVPIAPSITDPDGYVSTVTPHVEEFAMDWTLSAAEIARYTPDTTDADGVNESHQCILAEILAPDGTIVTKSVHRNMNFNAVNDEAAPFSHGAEVSAKGYGLPWNGEPGQKFLLRIFTRTWSVNLADRGVQEVVRGGKSPEVTSSLKEAFKIDLLIHREALRALIAKQAKTVSFIEYVVKGYLYTGQKVELGGTTHDLVRPVGSYGHVVRHEGPVEEWEFFIEGAERINRNTYVLTIPAEQTARIMDRVKAIEPPPWSILLHGGAAVPLGAFAQQSLPGPNLIAGIGYSPHPAAVFQALFGYNYLAAQAAPAAPTHLMSLSLQARYQQALGGNLLWYAGGGPGLYTDQSLSTMQVGVNAATGLDYRLARSLMLEAGVDCHYLPVSSQVYLHGHLGIVLRF